MPQDEGALPRYEVLVVEDEMLIRMMLVDVLSEAGLVVKEAGNGRDALGILEESGHELRAVVLDIRLPDMNGDALLAEIRVLRSDMPVVLATGYDPAEVLQRLPPDAKVRVLGKPFQPNALVAIFRDWGILG
jgi:CheY-like chemotaxis protein